MSFDRLAPYYLWMEAVLAGDKLQRCRTTFLPDVAATKKVLICGEGSGRFLKAFLKNNSDAKVLCLDSSRGMLNLAATQIRPEDCARVEFLCADIFSWEAPRDRYDLIVTNFFFDCFRREQIESIVAKLALSAQPKAMWLLADFHVPPAGPRRIRARLILWLMYRFFRVATALSATTLVAPDAFLKQHGFQLAKERCSEWGLLKAALWRRAIV